MNVYVLNIVTINESLDFANSTCQVFDNLDKASKSMVRKVMTKLKSKPTLKIERIGGHVVRLSQGDFVRTYTISKLAVL